MKNLLVTGSAGLIGSEAVKFFAKKGFKVYGIDNDMRAYFFGKEASTKWNLLRLKEQVKNYEHFNVDIRERGKIEDIFKKIKFDLIIHTAAQPSHDWATKEPLIDFTINAVGTQIILESLRRYSPEAVFIFTSTNKVYGDRPNTLPLVELKKRFELPENHRYYQGIDESMSIDDSKHSLFGVSKVAADVMVQEYGKYFGLKTAVFRGGCLTGPFHSGTMLHGFLAYLIKCIATGRKYTILGYKGKQVRDNIHSFDLVNAFYHVYEKPRCGEVYNIGGSRYANISILEAIEKIEGILGKKANVEYKEENRAGDHIWYISDVSKFQEHYPKWQYGYSLERTIEEICLSGHFSSIFSGTSTLTFFEKGLSKPRIGKVFFAAHFSGAYGPVQALRLFLSSLAKEVISSEHLLEKSNGFFGYLKDLYLDIYWFLKNGEDAKVYFGINPINALAGVLLKVAGFRFKLIYYSVDYSFNRFPNPILNWLFHGVESFCMRNADLVWSGSPEMVKMRERQGLLKKKNILVRSGIMNSSLFAQRRPKTTLQKQTIVVDGFLSNILMAKLVLSAVSILRKKYPEINLKIVAGTLPREELIRSIRSNGLSLRTEVIENIPHQKAISGYKNYGIGAALFESTQNDPAVYRDPTEIKEFLAAGLPVIAPKEFQISRELEEKTVGFAVEENAEDLKRAFSFILSHPGVYDKFSKNALAYTKNLTWEKNFEKALRKSNLV